MIYLLYIPFIFNNEQDNKYYLSDYKIEINSKKNSNKQIIWIIFLSFFFAWLSEFSFVSFLFALLSLSWAFLIVWEKSYLLSESFSILKAYERIIRTYEKYKVVEIRSWFDAIFWIVNQLESNENNNFKEEEAPKISEKEKEKNNT